MNKSVKLKNVSKSAKAKNARIRTVLGFTRNLAELCLSHQVKMAEIGHKVIKSLPLNEGHIDKVIEISAQAQAHAQAVENSANEFAAQVLQSDTVKQCAARVLIAVTDRVVRQIAEAPLPHEQTVEKAYAQGYKDAQGYEDAHS